jgi:hypothetical protein
MASLRCVNGCGFLDLMAVRMLYCTFGRCICSEVGRQMLQRMMARCNDDVAKDCLG